MRTAPQGRRHHHTNEDTASSTASANDRPQPSSEAVRASMVANRGRDTKPEMMLRRMLHRSGYRYRVHYPVPGATRRKVDIAFVGRKVAVEVYGCFWHWCPEHASLPSTNRKWWTEKLRRNVARDEEKRLLLENAGWQLVVVWEHESVTDAYDRVTTVVDEAGNS